MGSNEKPRRVRVPTRSTRDHQLALRDLALTERRGATGAEVIVDLLVRQNEQELFTDRHGFAALLTIERRGAEAFELLHVGIMESGLPSRWKPMKL